MRICDECGLPEPKLTWCASDGYVRCTECLDWYIELIIKRGYEEDLKLEKGDNKRDDTNGSPA